MKTNPNEPIDAIQTEQREAGLGWIYSGLTKREYFSAMAMQGMIFNKGVSWHSSLLADEAVNLADALIKELNKGE